MLGSTSGVLRAFFSSLEDGDIFRQLGILNLLEGDFFSWYGDKNQWNKDLASALQNILEILGRYEDVSGIFASAEAIDLFRELYEATVPQIVRGSFGEFYTPYWLADHVLESSTPTGKWNALDPCCGSGTFIIVAISRIRKENPRLPRHKLLKEILTRITGVDLNPLAVLTTRINYFIHIAPLLPENPHKLVLPVYLGDASYIPEIVKIAGVKCLKYNLRTLKTPISIELPISIVKNIKRFVELMQKYEQFVKNRKTVSASELLLSHINKEDRKKEVEKIITHLTTQLVVLERKGWNEIWARIITNFLATGCLGKFTNIIGNPPWVDWKNLPAGYRGKVKSLCIDKGLFSGAGRTGGINLNICALITHVAASNWLDDKGVLAFLMPRELAYQASYDGWRASVGGPNRSFLAFHDWSKAGHPFDSSKEDFMTFLIGQRSKTEKRFNNVPVYRYIKKKGVKLKAYNWSSLSEAMNNLERLNCLAGQIIPRSSAFTFAGDKNQLYEFTKIAGECAYIGREGIEFYPQELLIFQYIKAGPLTGTVFLNNIQSAKSKYRIGSKKILLETKYLYPLVKRPNIESFAHNYENLIVPFPYEKNKPHKPVSFEKLQAVSPLLLEFYNNFEDVIRAQTEFSDRIRGTDAGEFYGLARTGPYSFQRVYVAFRDNTKWRASVITSKDMPWGEVKRFVFQNHAASICERRDLSGFIDEEEAHYICAIFNAPIVEEFIYATSDMRSFKIRPPIFVPIYQKSNKIHKKLSELSYAAHKSRINIEKIRPKLDELYLQICRDRL